MIINLVPWRRQCVIRNTMITALLQGVLWLLVSIYIFKQPSLIPLNNELDRRQQQNQQLQQQLMQQHQQQKSKAKIQKQLSVIVYLAKHLPNNSRLTTLKLNKQQLTLNGLAENQTALNTVSALIHTLPYYKTSLQWQVHYQKQGLHFSLEMKHD